MATAVPPKFSNQCAGFKPACLLITLVTAVNGACRISLLINLMFRKPLPGGVHGDSCCAGLQPVGHALSGADVTVTRPGHHVLGPASIRQIAIQLRGIIRILVRLSSTGDNLPIINC